MSRIVTGDAGEPFCLFCAIVEGTVPAAIVAESDLTIGFRDINPVAPSHILIIPRRHIVDAAAIDGADGPLLADMLTLAQQLAAAEGISGSGYRLVFNVGDDAGNSVPHLHLHLVGGRGLAWPPG
jgi:histidine triad (HIT) family protein